MDPHTGAIIAMGSNPRYDTPADVAVQHSKKAGECSRPQRCAGQAAAGERLPRALHAGLDVQGHHHLDRPARTASPTLDRRSRTPKSWVPPQTTDPIQNYGGTVCGGTMVEVFYRSCNIPFAQIGHRARAARRWSRARRSGASARRSRSTCRRPAASSFGEVADFTDQLPLLAIGGFGQGSDQMVPLHMAHGRQHRRQRRRDDEATRDRCRTTRPRQRQVRHPNDALRVEARRSCPRTADTLDHVDDRRRQPGHRPAHATRQRDSGSGQDRHRPVQHHRPRNAPTRWIIGFAPAVSPQDAIAVVLKGGPTTRSAPSPVENSPDRSPRRCSTTLRHIRAPSARVTRARDVRSASHSRYTSWRVRRREERSVGST